MSHSVIQCPSCGNDIEPGQRRKATEEGPKHGYCVLHDSLFEKYRFYITNPAKEEVSGISFWRVYDDNNEFPVMSKSDELLVNCSSSLYSGSHGIKPTDDFFNVVGYSIHDVMAFTGGIATSRQGGIRSQIEDSFKNTMAVFYEDTKMPKHEQEICIGLVTQIIPQTFPYVIPELGPIRDFANECTKFKVPEVHPELE